MFFVLTVFLKKSTYEEGAKYASIASDAIIPSVSIIEGEYF